MNTTKGIFQVDESDRWRQALSTCTEAINADPEKGNLYMDRGSIYLKLGELEEAIFDFNTAIKFNFRTSMLYSLRGQTYLMLEEYRKASTEFSISIKLNPENTEAYAFRGLARFHLGDQASLERSLQDCNTALTLGSQDVSIYHLRGKINYQLGEYTNSVRDLTTYIRSKPKNPDAYCLRGKALFALDMPTQAIADYGMAVKLDPKESLYFYWRGLAFLEIADFVHASIDFYIALQSDVNDSEIHDYLTIACRELGLTADEMTPKTILQKAIDCMDSGNNTVFQNCLDVLLGITPRNWCFHIAKGLFHASNGRYKMAIENYSRAIKCSPNKSEGYFLRGISLSRLGQSSVLRIFEPLK